MGTTTTDHGATILVVDDNPGNVALLGELLQPEYRVIAATSGRRALELARGEPQPDLVLLDVMMPDLDGYAVYAQLREDERTCAIPVIFVTALNAAEDEEKGLSLGAVDYISKPLRPRVVLARVRTHLELKQARDLLDDRSLRLEAAVLRRTAELATAKAAAEASNRTKSAFLANIRHELNTPMNGILGMIELALDEPDVPTSVREYLAIARDSGRAMTELLAEILEFVALADGQATVEAQPYSVAALLESVAERYAASARDKGLSMIQITGADVEAEIIGDQRKIRQVLNRLIDNALEFTTAGTVTLGAERTAGKLHFWVADTGCGIPEEIQNTMFDAFTQADDSLTRDHQGVGLGLSIARALVRVMGGQLSVESVAGKGSTFRFWVHKAESL